jgi:hypothetical protein
MIELLEKEKLALQSSAEYKKQLSTKYQVRFKFVVQETNIYFQVLDFAEEVRQKLKNSFYNACVALENSCKLNSPEIILKEEKFTHLTVFMGLRMSQSQKINYRKNFELLFKILANDFFVLSANGTDQSIGEIVFRLRTEFDIPYVGTRIRPVSNLSNSNISSKSLIISAKEIQVAVPQQQQPTRQNQHQQQQQPQYTKSALLFVID